MEQFGKLQEKINQLVAKFEKLETEKSELERDCLHLKEQVKSLETQLKNLTHVNERLEKSAREKNEIALKRISKLVDKIDQFQSEMKFS